MRVAELIGLYIKALDDLGYDPAPNDMGTGLHHASWMAYEIGYGEPMPEAKEQRWIGYIQCLLNCGGIYTLEELKQHSRDYLC